MRKHLNRPVFGGLLSIALAIAFMPAPAQATEGKLDPHYRDLQHPIDDTSDARRAPVASYPSASDTLSVIELLAAPRDQGERGTCSIFSATALLEALLVHQGLADRTLDLSEEWLEYLSTTTTGVEGSDSVANFRLLKRYGDVDEKVLPYISEDWPRRDYSPLSLARCGTLHSTDLKTCLHAHRDPALLAADDADLNDPSSPLYDPAFANIRARALRFRDEVLPDSGDRFRVRTVSEIKSLLAHGIPLTLDLDFFIGAWNHSSATSKGIRRSLINYKKGIVSYPEVGSKDRTISKREPDGHSVLVVGYDDTVEVTAPIPMNDGSIRTFTYRGVYYFRNSWGTDTLGSEFEIDGRSHPGYAMITQKYAHEFGAFYQLPLERR